MECGRTNPRAEFSVVTNPFQAPLKTVRIQEPGAHQAHGWAFLRLGFRPFYLGAALFAMVAVPAWVLVWLGYLQWTPALAPVWWHAHEMLFGFVAAVVIGFLMTAGKAWTGLPTPRGSALGALALVWLAARVALWWVPYGVYAVLDFILLPSVALILLRVLLRSGNRRNLPIAGLLGFMALANGVFHASVLGWLNLSPQVPLYAMLSVVVLLESVMAGRVIPGFTMSAIPGVSIKPLVWLERSVMLSTGLGLALWVFAPAEISPLTAWVLAFAALLHGVRQSRWSPWACRTRPMLWILQIAYAWFSIGLGLLAVALWGGVAVSVSAAIHGLAVGATGCLILGMITRTARGHTGRKIEADWREETAFGLILFAGAARVVWPMLAPHQTAWAVGVSALAWAMAFFIYAITYGPWLMQARKDAKDG